MPYVNEEAREHIEGYENPRNAGELNYAITLTALEYMGEKPFCYQTFNDIIGALEGAKLELYRRMIAPYEDTKIEENGDVYYDRDAVVQQEGTPGAEEAKPLS